MTRIRIVMISALLLLLTVVCGITLRLLTAGGSFDAGTGVDLAVSTDEDIPRVDSRQLDDVQNDKKPAVAADDPQPAALTAGHKTDGSLRDARATDLAVDPDIDPAKGVGTDGGAEGSAGMERADSGMKGKTPLVRSLLKPPAGRDADFRQHEYSERDLMLNELRARQGLETESIGVLEAIYQDARQGDVMRGYALQHLCLLYIDNVSALSMQAKRQIIETFRDGLRNEDGGTIAGTALVGLREVSRADPAVLAEAEVRAAVRFVLARQTGGHLPRISAFQIAGELRMTEVGEKARAVAFDESADWVLRMSSIYALGRIGQTGGLRKLLKDENANVAGAARAALKGDRG